MEEFLHDKTILIVDDVPENLDILNELLSDFKRKVAINGEKAIEIANSDQPPDLILLDIEMPGMSGFEVCKSLKNNGKTDGIPIIFLTARTDKRDTVKGIELGAADFITKPFDSDELMVRVRTQLELAEFRRRTQSTIQQIEQSSSLLKYTSEETSRQKKIIEEERQKVDDLLTNILPEFVAKELKEKGSVTPHHFPYASVLFTDLAGFTKLSQGLSPKEIIDELNTIFIGFDEIMERNNMEKIKTIGDGYMAVGGVPIPNGSNAVDAVNAGLELVRFVRRVREENKKLGKPEWNIRIGIHTGDLVAGMIGKNKFAYDVWGITVNTASRMESSGEPGKVNISGITYQLVKDKFDCEYRGNIEVKNMGRMDMYFASSKD